MQDARDTRDIRFSHQTPVKSELRERLEKRSQQTDKLYLQALRRSVKFTSDSEQLSSLEQLEKLVKTDKLADDVSEQETSLVPAVVPPPPVIPTNHPTKTEPSFRIKRYLDPLVITSPLAAVEAAIIAHIELYKRTPRVLFVAESTRAALAAQYMRVKFAPFTGIYHHCLSFLRLETIHIYAESEIPTWMRVIHGVERDAIYSVHY